jgi:MFS family permease
MSTSYRWVIVGAGALMTCVAFGAMFSSAMTLNFLVMGVGGFVWGAVSDRYGARIVVTIGAVLLGLALVLASRAMSLPLFQATYGVLVGVAASTFFAPLIATTMAWFDAHRSLAVALVSAGVGVAPMTVSPFARWLIDAYGWRAAMLAIGIAAWVLLLPATLLVRRAPAVAAAAPADDAGGQDRRAAIFAALRSPKFIVLGLTFFACCMAHSGPIFHMVTYAMTCGIAPMAAVSIYSVEGLAGLGGRLVYGLLADRLGVKPVLIAGLTIQALVIAAYLFASRLDQFYALAVIFGGTYGGVMPLYAVLAHEYFGPRILGTVFGAAIMLSSLGMAAGPLVGGWIYDINDSYAWLFVASAMVGLGAAAIALAFPPPVRAPGVPA